MKNEKELHFNNNTMARGVVDQGHSPDTQWPERQWTREGAWHHRSSSKCKHPDNWGAGAQRGTETAVTAAGNRPAAPWSATVAMWAMSSTPRCLPKRSKIGVHAGICTRVFLTALLTIARKWEDPQVHAEEWKIRLACPYHTVLSTIKGHESHTSEPCKHDVP